jgi:hypothetical protein
MTEKTQQIRDHAYRPWEGFRAQSFRFSTAGSANKTTRCCPVAWSKHANDPNFRAAHRCRVVFFVPIKCDLAQWPAWARPPIKAQLHPELLLI